MKTSSRFRHAAWIRSGDLALALLTILGALVLSADSRAAQIHRILHNFDGSDGATPTCLLLSNGTLFGTTSSGGDANRGTVFRLNTNATDFTVLKHFAGGDGDQPWGNLVLSGSTLYGTTSSGGISNCGTVFKLGTDGGDFTVLKQFVGSDGLEPRGLVISDTTLYGTTFHGGISNRGTIFKLNTDGSTFAILKEFTDPEMGGVGSDDGCLPSGCLAHSGTNLYGTTMWGGTFGRGVVFKVNTDGTGYTVLQQGNFTDGGHFFLGVTVADTTLYGATAMGSGGSMLGDIFRLNTDGSGYTSLAPLTGFNGTAASSLVLSGSKLYGTAVQGGQFNAGVVFMLNPGGRQLIPIKQFQNFDGFGPRYLVSAGNVLYGVTDSGGSFDRGTVFGITLQPPAILQAPQSQTAETGATVRFRVHAEGNEPLGCEWICDGTKVLSHTTNTLLVLTNVQVTQAGGYTLVVTNLFGAVTSSPAMLNVIAPVERRPVPGVKVTGTAGSVLNLDCTTSLNPEPNWLPLGTVTLTSASQFWCDDTMPLPPQRFYRASQTAPAGLIPTLDLHLIPALTLTGTVGQLIRVDAINAIGPTDAWFPLDTVTLTNTAQLYFDVTAPGQPRRLYRLVPGP